MIAFFSIEHQLFYLYKYAATTFNILLITAALWILPSFLFLLKYLCTVSGNNRRNKMHLGRS